MIDALAMVKGCLRNLKYFLGLLGPLGTPSFVRPPARGQEKYGSAVQDHCHVWWWLVVSESDSLMHVWWCLVVSMYIVYRLI